LQITVWLAKAASPPLLPTPPAPNLLMLSTASPSAPASLSEGRLLLSRGTAWKPIRWRVPLASAPCLPDLKVMLGGREP